jgi:hypothetical protein
VGKERPTRPRPARARTLPPDEKSLEALFRSLHADLARRAAHVKREPHDGAARAGFRALHDMRSRAWQKLYDNEPHLALSLAGEFSLVIPEVSHDAAP